MDRGEKTRDRIMNLVSKQRLENRNPQYIYISSEELKDMCDCYAIDYADRINGKSVSAYLYGITFVALYKKGTENTTKETAQSQIITVSDSGAYLHIHRDIK